MMFVTIILLFYYAVEAKKESTMKAVIEARNKIRLEVIDLKEKLTLAKETIAKFKEEIAKISKAGGSLSVAWFKD